MIVHETPGFWTREGGTWVEQPDSPPLLVGGTDVWVDLPPEWHVDECPCTRCVMYRAASVTIAEDQESPEPTDPEMTPEDIKRLEEHNGG